MTDGVRVEAGAACGAEYLLCDLYHPDPARANGTATILLHGGGWRAGDRTMMADPATALAGHGFLAVALEYRLLGAAPWPAQLDDTKAAVRWLRGNADRFGIDPRQITLTGFSAGAHLALLAAGTADGGERATDSAHHDVPERVAAVAAFFPPTRLGSGQARMLGLTPEAARAASPITHAAASFPPTLLLHGTDDTMVPHSASVQMFDALIAAGAAADLRLYAGLPHEFQQLPGLLEPTMADVAAFFERQVVQRERFEAARDAMQRRWEERMQAVRAGG